jgi:hypothetical protein
MNVNNKICSILVLSRVGVTYKTGFGVDDWIYCTLYIPFRNYRQCSAIVILHTFQFTVTHTLGFSVFISRIVATDISQSHCHFDSHMKSSCHNLIPFLLFLSHLDCHLQNSIQLQFRLLSFTSSTLLLLLYTPSRLVCALL